MNPYSTPSSKLDNQHQEAPTGQGKAIAALILGILGLLLWLIPILGLPITITGLVLGINSRKGMSRGLATAGLIMCSIGLFLASINAAYGAYLGATGQHELINALKKE